MLKKTVQIYTDGACRGNPGIGGWGASLSYNGTHKEIYGGEKETTNNRMEMTAVIEAIKALKQPSDITINSDSKYVLDVARQIKGNEILIELSDSVSPTLVYDKDDKEVLFVLMPMRV